MCSGGRKVKEWSRKMEFKWKQFTSDLVVIFFCPQHSWKMSIRPHTHTHTHTHKNNNKTTKTKQKQKMFYGQMDLPSRVCLLGVCLFVCLFVFSIFFFQKNFGKIFWLIFKKFQIKCLDFGQKMADFTRFWKN